MPHRRTGFTRRTSRWVTSTRWIGPAFCCAFLAPTALAQATAVWEEDWEGDWTAQWKVSGGVWSVAVPSSGPGNTGRGTLAATNPAGNYPESSDARLARTTPFVVPAAEENPRLRFYHWFDFGGGDYGRIELRVNGGEWQAISGTFTGPSGVFSSLWIGLSAFAGESVEIAFHLVSRNCCTGADAAPGWYVDRVELLTGEPAFNDPDSFDTLGDWRVERGVWEVGDGVAVTIRDGNYPESQSSRLTSTPFVVPPADQLPRLRFRHWFSYGGGDYGEVQVRIAGEPAWMALSRRYTGSSGVWTRPSADLSGFAGQTIELAFLHVATNCCTGYDNASGWWVDDLTVVTGPPVFENPGTFDDLGDWHVEHGVWEVRDGVAVTVKDGNYPESQSSRLVSPPFRMPPAKENPRLRFSHWFSYGGGDYGQVQVLPAGGGWETVSVNYVGSSGVWSRPLVDLSKFGGQDVRLAFFHRGTNCCTGFDNAAGWWIDDLEIVSGPTVVEDPTETPLQDFESGVGDWWIENGVWEVGPSGSSFGMVGATVLGGNYPESQSSRLISAPFIVPPASENPRLRFRHWFSYGGGDHGQVQIRLQGGDWQNLSRRYTGPSSVWTLPYLDLGTYAGETVELGFRHVATNCCTGFDNAAGWWIDDVQVVTGPIRFNNPEPFDELGDWRADHGVWEARDGVLVTVKDGNYPESQRSRFVSPFFEVPSAAQNPRLRFRHWFSYGGGDSGRVQIRTSGDGWQDLSRPYTGPSAVWSRAYLDLSGYAGRSVQFAFLHSGTNCCTGFDNAAGWWIDDVEIVTGPILFNDPEAFDELGDWRAEHGVWEVRDGVLVTVKDGNYPESQSSRFVSPFFEVPSAAQRPRLRFRHWFSYGGGDHGQVQIRASGGDWVAISRTYTGPSAVWTRPYLDLSSYASQKAQLGFVHVGRNCCTGFDNAAGWWIDDVEIVTGPVIFDDPEDFEDGMGDWRAEHGVWEVRDGVLVTVRDGNYPESQSSRFVSPFFRLPSAGQEPVLRFWHWFSYGGGDSGRVQIRSRGGAWEDLWPTYAGPSSVWTRPAIGLNRWAGEEVQLGFLHRGTNCCTGFDNAAGWWVDNITVDKGPYVLQHPEGFEGGLGDWRVDKGVWQVGEPGSGPGRAHTGRNVAATVLGGNYPESQSSRLVSPPIRVPPAATEPQLLFRHWHRYGGGDRGEVQIWTQGTGWVTPPGMVFTGNRNWTQKTLPLSDYGGRTIHLAFLHVGTNCCTGFDNAPGWYIDDIRLEPDITVMFERGDTDASGEADITDAIRILGLLFLGDPGTLDCEKTADTNDDGEINVTDPVLLLRHLFADGREPAAPWEVCGTDPTPDPVTCVASGCAENPPLP